MSRESFQQELDRLVADVMELGGEVQATIADMVEALERQDANLAGEQLGIDARFKVWGEDIDEKCLILQARQAPVAGDLRLLYTIQTITNHLVRAGTLNEHICQVLVDTAEEERDEDLESVIIQMAHNARELMEHGLKVFEERDIDEARNLQAMDDKVDLLYSEVMSLVSSSAPARSGSEEWWAKAALIVHYLERIADHGVAIGGRTVFLVTGERIESAIHQYRQRRIDSDEDD